MSGTVVEVRTTGSTAHCAGDSGEGAFAMLLSTGTPTLDVELHFPSGARVTLHSRFGSATRADMLEDIAALLARIDLTGCTTEVPTAEHMGALIDAVMEAGL